MGQGPVCRAWELNPLDTERCKPSGGRMSPAWQVSQVPVGVARMEAWRVYGLVYVPYVREHVHLPFVGSFTAAGQTHFCLSLQGTVPCSPPRPHSRSTQGVQRDISFGPDPLAGHLHSHLPCPGAQGLEPKSGLTLSRAVPSTPVCALPRTAAWHWVGNGGKATAGWMLVAHVLL